MIDNMALTCFLQDFVTLFVFVLQCLLPTFLPIEPTSIWMSHTTISCMVKFLLLHSFLFVALPSFPLCHCLSLFFFVLFHCRSSFTNPSIQSIQSIYSFIHSSIHLCTYLSIYHLFKYLHTTNFCFASFP